MQIEAGTIPYANGFERNMGIQHMTLRDFIETFKCLDEKCKHSFLHTLNKSSVKNWHTPLYLLSSNFPAQYPEVLTLNRRIDSYLKGERF